MGITIHWLADSILASIREVLSGHPGKKMYPGLHGILCIRVSWQWAQKALLRCIRAVVPIRATPIVSWMVGYPGRCST